MSPSSSSSASAYPSSSATATKDPQTSMEPSGSHTPSTTPSNGTLPVPPDNAQTTNDALTPGDKAGIGLGSIAAICVAGLMLIKFSPALKNVYVQQFGSSSKGMKKGVSFRKPVSADVPITINHNPQVLVQHRLEQLKDLQKQVSRREIQNESSNPISERTKKEFGPIISGESV